nr:hypothetical protein CFP56_10029 [Quercus suber]
MVGHDPHGQEEGEKAEDMDEEDDTFCEGQVLGEKDVEADGEQQDQEDQQGGLPQAYDIGVRVDEQDHLLDDADKLGAAGRDAADPTKATAPANDVGEGFLIRARGELGDVVVLTAGSRGHGGHLGHGGDQGEHEQPDGDRGPDDAGGAPVEQSIVVGQESTLPGGL